MPQMLELPVDDSAGPAVSIVMATYNRPEVLGFAIRSVLAQKFQDWELIVVGDHCSKSTADVVSSFDDQRIGYVNLALNYGEQSGPNNVGIARASGDYIAFLNHDDFWFPDHLRAGIDWLQASGADVVVARSAFIVAAPPCDWHADEWAIGMDGIGRRGNYDPVLTIGPASSLILKSSVAQSVGPWRAAADCFGSSSQEWLFRIWRRGFNIRTMPHLTVIQIQSGGLPGSYVCGDVAGHRFFEAQLKKPLELRLLLLDRWRQPQHPLWKQLGKWAAPSCLRAAAYCGIAPAEVLSRFYRRNRRGSFINKLRKIRGLLPLPERDPSADSLRSRYAAQQQADKEMAR